MQETLSKYKQALKEHQLSVDIPEFKMSEEALRISLLDDLRRNNEEKQKLLERFNAKSAQLAELQKQQQVWTCSHC